MKKWKKLKETDISPSKWFPIAQHSVKLPNGKIINDYFISPMDDVVMVFPLTKKNEVVLVKQYKHAAEDVIIELPAGFQQKNKSLKESAIAELEEEVGIKTSTDNLIFLGKTIKDPTKNTSITYCYLAKDLEFNSRQNLDDTEEIEIIISSPKEVMAMIKNGEIWAADTVVTVMRAYFTYPELFDSP